MFSAAAPATSVGASHLMLPDVVLLGWRCDDDGTTYRTQGKSPYTRVVDVRAASTLRL